jgi:hypothetical protein
MSNLYRGLSKDASYEISINSAKGFQRRRFFRNLSENIFSSETPLPSESNLVGSILGKTSDSPI